MPNNEIFKRVGKILDAADQDKKKEQGRVEEERRNLVTNIGQNIVGMMTPLLEKIGLMARVNKEDIKEAISELNITVPPPEIPEIKIPKIEVPTPQVTVKAPTVNFPNEMDVKLNDHSLTFKKPVPVTLTDENGKPYVAGTIGGGGINISKIRIQGTDAQGVRRDFLVDEGGRLQVDIISGGGGGTQYTEDSGHASGDTGNMLLAVRNDAGTALAGTDLDYIPISTDSSGNVRTTFSGSVEVKQVSGFIDSVKVTGFDTSVGASLLNGDGNAYDARDRNWTITESVEVKQVSGFINSVKVTGFDTSVGASLLGGDGAAYDARDRNWTITETVPISTTQSFEVKQVSGFSNSVNVIGISASAAVVGDVASDVADSGEGPVKIGGIARIANPTAVAAGDRVSATFDDVGRVVNYPYQVRDLITTARVSLTNGTETTLLAGVSGVFHDCAYIKGSNSSSGAVTVDIRDATTGGIVTTLDIPANSVAGVATPVPIPQNAAADTWTADMGDYTNTTVVVEGLFIKNV